MSTPRLPEGLKLRHFVSLHKEFDADDGEITRTRKLRRNVVEERYAPIIDAIYAGQTSVAMKAQIVYETGEVGVTERKLRGAWRPEPMDLSYSARARHQWRAVGLMYSLVAMGIVLIYKSSSVPNLAQGALTMLGAYVVLAFANGAGLPIWLAIPLAMLTMFGIGMGIERVALRRLAGRPIVMILMMTLGPGHLPARRSADRSGAAPRARCRLGISDDPLFLGPLLLNRAYAVGAVVALALFRCSCSSSARAAAWCCARSPTTTRPHGRWASRSSAAWRCPGRCPRWSPPPPACCGASIQGVDQSLSLLLLKGITVAVLGGMDSIGGAILAGIAARRRRGRGRQASSTRCSAAAARSGGAR